MKKGFTLVELLGAIAILVVILLIALPIYNGVSSNINQSVYESKIKEVISKGEIYAEEHGKMVFDIKTLIKEGKLESDNELSQFKDPRNKRDMSCDIVVVSINDGMFSADVKESDKCYTEEELQNLYGMFDLKIVRADKTEIPSIEGTDWLAVHPVYVKYELKSEYQQYKDFITSIIWLGEEQMSCSKEKNDLSDCDIYPNPEIKKGIEVVTTKNVVITAIIKINIEGVEIENRVSKVIKLDSENPILKERPTLDETNTKDNRKVTFEITDNSGSGVKEYAIVTESTCNGEEYNKNKKSASDGVQTEYLKDGEYYICIMDKVGNKTSDDDLKNKPNNYYFEVKNVDQDPPSATKLEVVSSEKDYNSLDTIVTLEVSDSKSSKLKMCVSNTGYLKNCKWVDYDGNSFDWNVDQDIKKGLDGSTRTVYVSIQDEAGNVENISEKYKVYKECSEQEKVNGSWNSCDVACKETKQKRPFENKDKHTGTKCGSGEDVRNTVKFEKGTNSGITNGWYKSLQMNITLPNGTTSSKYCFGSSSCNPLTILSGKSLTFPNSANEQRLCVKPIGDDDPCTCCTDPYNVDGVSPNVTVSGNPTSWTKNSVTLKVDASDDHSKLQAKAYSFDGGKEWQKGNTKTYSSNTKNIVVQVRDNAGNIYTHETINITKIEDEAPTVNLTVTTYGSYVEVSADATSQSGIAEYKFCRDNKTVCITSESPTVTFSNVPNGDHDITVTVTTNAGRTATDKKSAAVAFYLRKISSSDTSGMWEYKENITKIVIQNELKEIPNAVKVSNETSDGSANIKSYVVLNSDGQTYTAYLQSKDKILLNPNSSNLFMGFNKLERIEGISHFDTSNVTNMRYMFCFCESLISLNLSNFNTSNVTDMREMFSYCSSLTSLDISHFDTSNVTNMNWMFAKCSSLTNLDLNNFDTSNVTNMSDMFLDCESLTRINVSSFDTSDVTNMHSMFKGCSSLTSLDVSNFDTSNVTDMSFMFEWCSSLTSLNLSNFNTSIVTDMCYMFSGCSSLTSLDVSNFDTSIVTDMGNMFSQSSSLTRLDLSNFDTTKVTDMSAMFSWCSSLTSITYGAKFIHFNNASMDSMFWDCPANKPTHSSWNGKF